MKNHIRVAVKEARSLEGLHHSLSNTRPALDLILRAYTFYWQMRKRDKDFEKAGKSGADLRALLIQIQGQHRGLAAHTGPRVLNEILWNPTFFNCALTLAAYVSGTALTGWNLAALRFLL